MALSQTVYTGTGIVGPYTVSFPYIDKSHVKVYVDGTATTDFTWPTTSTITFNTAIASGAVILIKRETPNDERLVEFQNTALTNSSNFNLEGDQDFNLIQELADNSLQLNNSANWDGKAKRITNVAEPVNASDVATFSTVSGGAITACRAQATIAAEQADIATEQATIATEQATIATEQATIATEQAQLSDNEKAYWANKAALLDPLAYSWYIGNNFTFTVPANETWYAINLWYVTSPGTEGTHYTFLRKLDADHPLALPPGTVISADGSQTAFAYICKPKTVFDVDTRYTTDPKSLYYERLSKLRSLSLSSVTLQITAGQARGTQVTQAFPTDFTNGLITLASSDNVSWCGLASASGTMNTLYEISDDHQMRFADTICCPFVRTTFPNFKARSASITGNSTDTSILGHAALRYYKLPVDW